ncbi:type II toxin-antitoxin system VapC family toxin [Flavobacterium yafengii]|uniref:type II toxin-antitoxin system VapC family toxin n=1 Tax=Flavobacterium yafengii TaxID=3041253 RepID=UPI0024A7C533|nr:PIN domain-containing protein [Flavobacterium yafengii]MDI5896612.1 PIN domain-containing protein [Flavobacterium yafengii]
MKLFLDANVVLDLILKRQPFFDNIAKIITVAENKNYKLYISSVTFVNVNYIACKFADKKNVLESLKMLRIVFDVLSVSETEIDKALYSKFNDFEDAVQHYCALKYNCNYIITRDLKDFKNSEIPVMTPTEFLVSINIQ